MSEADQVQALVAAAIECFGKLTTLYNLAAPSRLIADEDRSVHELPEAVFDRMWAVITRGTYLVCRYGIPELMRGGGGSVINTSTTDAVIGQAGYDAYAAAKGGVLSLTKSIAQHYGRFGVRANVLMPGIIETAMTRGSLGDPAMREEWLKMTLLGRIARPEEIANAALYLASDESSYVTGSVHWVDGGWLLGPQPAAAFSARDG